MYVYHVAIREVYLHHVEVESPTPLTEEEIITNAEEIAQGDLTPLPVELEFSHTMSKEHWTIEEEAHEPV